MKKILISIFASIALVFSLTLLTSPLQLNAASYQSYIDGNTHNTPVVADTWISIGTDDYMVPKGFTPSNVLTNSAGTPVGTYFVTSVPTTFKDDGSGYTIQLSGMSGVHLWNGTAWVAFSGSSVTIRKSGSNWGYYQYGGASLVFNLHSNLQFGIKRLASDLQPAISGESTYISNVDSPRTEAQIRSTIKAIDDVDGNISHLIQLVEDNYTANNRTLGTYTIKYRVQDSAGNVTNFTASVLVVDATKPIITGISTFNVSYTTSYNIQTFITQKLSVTDNYDTGLTIGVESNDYTPNYNRIGSYNVVFNAIDASTNKGLHTVVFNVIDDVAPTWSGSTTITKNATEILTVNDIKALVTATDYIDGVVPHTVKTDGYSGNAHKVGTYKIVFQASDSSGNTSTKEVTITVKDNIPPVFFVDNYWININNNTVLTQQQIIDLLINTGQITVNATTQVMFTMNQYEHNETIPGVYAMSVLTRSTSGEEQEKAFAITVLEARDDGGIIVAPDEPNFIVKLIEYAKEEPVMFALYTVGILLIMSVVTILTIQLTSKHPHTRKTKYSKYIGKR